MHYSNFLPNQLSRIEFTAVVTSDRELGYDSHESGNWMSSLNPLMRIHWRASLMPVAAVIRAPIAHT